MKETTRQEKGITLIALVLTIIVLMILAAVSVATLTGDNGILTKAQEAKETAKKAEIQEQLRLAELSAKIKREGGAITVSDLLQELESQGVDFELGEDNRVTMGGKYIFEIEEINGELKFEDQGTVSKPKPKVVSIDIVEKTETSIRVKVSTLRNEGGTLKYYIQKENAEGYEFVEEQEGTKYTFELDPDTTYSKIKVEAIAKNGETGYLEIEISNIPSLDKPEAVTLNYHVKGQEIGAEDWTQGPLTVTVSAETQGYVLQTSQDGTNWKTGETGKEEIEENTKIASQETTQITSRATTRSTKQTSSQTFITNGTLYARLFDPKTNQAGKPYMKEITKIDITEPTINESQITNVTTNSITITGDATDAESGIATYSFSRDDGVNWEWNPTEGVEGGQTEASYTFSNLSQTQTYSLKIKVTDKVGNEAISETLTETTGSVPEGTANIEFRYSNANWTNGNVDVIISKKTGNDAYKLQYSKNGGEWIDYTEKITFDANGSVDARLTDNITEGQTGNVGAIATGNVTKIDTTLPTISKETPLTVASATTNSIGLKIKVTDSNSGLSKIKWFYKKSTETNYTTTEDIYQAMNGATAGATTEQEKTKTLTGLTANVTYNMYVEIYDVAGNMTREPKTGTVNKLTGTVPGGTANIEFSYSNANWTNGTVDVTISKKTGNNAYKLQYSTDDGKTWGDYTTQITMTKNGTITARLTDNTELGKTGNVGAIATGNVTKIDKTSPIISTTTPLTATSVSTNSIGLKIKVQDKKATNAPETDTVSGLSKIKWFYKKSTETNYTSTEDIYQAMNGAAAGATTEQEKTKTVRELTVGTIYYIYAEIYDVAGNKITSNVITEKTSHEANEPNLMSGMTAVYWDNNTEKTLTSTSTTEQKNTWYHYVAGDNQTDTKTSRWANAKITKNGADSYFVWIPRYEYKILSGEGTSTAGKIEIKFIPKTQTVADSGYKIHPAFQNGTSNHYMRGEWDKELSGIWVAKYETSRSDATSSSAGSSNTLKVVPNVQSWRNISIGDCYSKAYNYDRTKESHLMKNSEWGAVAYLTHSRWGRNGHEIDINNSGSCVTGNGGGSPNAAKTSGVVNAYNTSKGAQASTTGNIYGIYDLSGGAWELVAAYISNGNSSLSNGSPFANTTKDSEGYKTKSTKYATVYPYNSSNDSNGSNYTAYKNVGYGYGDSMFEIAGSGGNSRGWLSDYCRSPYGRLAFLC